jgi:hypothetical protein
MNETTKSGDSLMLSDRTANLMGGVWVPGQGKSSNSALGRPHKTRDSRIRHAGSLRLLARSRRS